MMIFLRIQNDQFVYYNFSRNTLPRVTAKFC